MCDSQLVTSSHFHIRSADRQNKYQTTPAEFTVNLSKPLKGSKAQLSFLQAPSSYYNVTIYNTFGYDDSVITISPGNYSMNDLISAVNTKLSLLPVDTRLSYNQITSLMTFSGSSNFVLSFGDNSMADILGFNPTLTYVGASTYTGSFVPKLYNNCIYMTVSFCGHIQTTTPYLNNVSFVIPHNVNRSEIIQFYSSTQFALQPKVKDQTIGTVDIRVFDENGNQLQGLGDWAMMLHII